MLKLPMIMNNLISIEYGADQKLSAGTKPPRLDQFIAQQLPQFSRAQIQNLIEDGQVLVDNQAQKTSYRLRSGQSIQISVPPPIASHIEAQEIPLDIVYEDEYLAVVNKATGMVTHPGAGVHSGTLVHALMHHMQGSLSGIGGVLRPGIVHRLDKDTSGLLVVAKTDQVHQHLSKQIQSKNAQRVYLAIVEGKLPKQAGLINAPIGRHPKKRTEMAIIENGRSAQTAYKVLASNDLALIGKSPQHFSLVELSLKTGRTHQIRVHLASLNCPVVGDTVYNHKITGTESARKKLALTGHGLHAYQLNFVHPVSHESLAFKAQLPENFALLVKKLFPGQGLEVLSQD
jgi:23S rRNA pseudouridine1911/1915/1917 synthase